MFIFFFSEKTNRKPAQQKTHPDSCTGVNWFASPVFRQPGRSAQTLVRQLGTIRLACCATEGRLKRGEQ